MPDDDKPMTEVERLKRQLDGFKKHYAELKLVRSELARTRAEQVNDDVLYDKVYGQMDRYRHALRKIADLEPELITVPQILGYVKRVLERL